MIGLPFALTSLRFDSTHSTSTLFLEAHHVWNVDSQGFHCCEIRKYSVGQGGEGVATQVEEYNIYSSGSVQA